MRTLTVSVLLSFGAMITMPVHAAPAADGSAAADASFERVADEFLNAYLAWRPSTATMVGVHDWDGRCPDLSPASISREIDRQKEYQIRLAAWDPATLSARNDYDRRLLLAGIPVDLFWLSDARLFARDPRIYIPDVTAYMTLSFAPLEQRLQHVISIENGWGDVFAAARANLDERLPRPLVETAILDARGAADFLAKDAVEAFAPVKDESLQAALRASTEKVVSECRAFVSFLEQDRLPKADDNFALGQDRYQRMLQSGMVPLSPEQLLEIGLREMKREQGRLVEAARIVDPGRKPLEIMQALQREHPAADGLVADTLQNLEVIHRFIIERDLVSFPSDIRVLVKETPAFARSMAAAMIAPPGPLERKATEAVYYVTPVDNKWSAAEKEEWLTQFNRYTSDMTSIHEAYPGHYLQGLHQQSPSLTRVEALCTDYAFVEGWAHYGEQMLIDEGFGAGGDRATAAKYVMAQSSDALLRICRLCVSIRMHCQGMTVDEATRFLQENAYIAEKPARTEAVRGTYDPEYLYYTLGKLELLKLREDYRKQEGAAFSLRRFHDAVLSHGAPPIRLLRELLLKDKALWDQVLPVPSN